MISKRHRITFDHISFKYIDGKMYRIGHFMLWVLIHLILLSFLWLVLIIKKAFYFNAGTLPLPISFLFKSNPNWLGYIFFFFPKKKKTTGRESNTKHHIERWVKEEKKWLHTHTHKPHTHNLPKEYWAFYHEMWFLKKKKRRWLILKKKKKQKKTDLICFGWIF